MKPDLAKMSKKELRAYVLAHRDDLEALEVLYNRRSPDAEAVWFHSPQNPEEEKQQFELFKRLVSEKESNSDNSTASGLADK